MNEEEENQEHLEWLKEAMERGRVAAKQRDEERAREIKTEKFIELVVLFVLLTVLLLSALFWK